MPTELNAIQTAFHFTTSGGSSLIQRIAEIETLALSNIQSGKSLDRVVTGALVSLRDACSAARVAIA